MDNPAGTPQFDEDIKLASEDDVEALYEMIRAAEKDSSLAPPLSHASMEVHLDWASLEERALGASVPERVRDTVSGWSDGVIGGLGILPILAIAGTLAWLQRTPFSMDIVGLFALAFVFIAIMVLWFFVAARALMESLSYNMRPVAYAFGVVAAAAFIFFLGTNLRRPPEDPRELTEKAAVAFNNNDVEEGVKAIVEASEKTTPTKDPELWLSNAHGAYRAVILFESHDDEDQEELKKLTDKAIELLAEAAEAKPNDASLWRKLAELHHFRGDIAAARAAIDRVKTMKNAPADERLYAQLIGSKIASYEISAQLAEGSTSPAERREITQHIDTEIAEVRAVSAEAPATPATTQLLTELCLQRVAAAETGEELRQGARCADEFVAREAQRAERPAGSFFTGMSSSPFEMQRGAARPLGVSASQGQTLETTTGGNPQR